MTLSWLLLTHEYTDVETGETIVTDVFIRQSGETVYVMNLYGYGYGESYMELHSDGTVDYPGQPLLDVDNALNPAGDWYNTDGSSMGNQGNVTPAAITWGLTVQWQPVGETTGCTLPTAARLLFPVAASVVM